MMIWGREIYCMKKNGDGIYDESLIQTVVLGGIQVSNMYNIFFANMGISLINDGWLEVD